MKRFLLLILSFVLAQCLQAQSIISDSLVGEIAYHADIMVNAAQAQHRIRAHETLLKEMDSFLARPGSFGISLDSIPAIAVVHSDSFRIVTWQLQLSEDEFQYGGFIQWPDHVIKLNDNRSWLNGAVYSTYSPSAWYGCIYYKIIPFEKSGKRYYVLFGFNAENRKINTKVADILDLTNSEPRFGMPVFVGKDKDQSRLILSYADASSVQIDYDPELNAIVHDHLESLQGIGPSGESLMVSDGSTEGWFLKDGKWVYLEKVYDVKMEEPPMQEVRKDWKEDKDIFGRPKKGS
jgi:hypothetical protein